MTQPLTDPIVLARDLILMAAELGASDPAATAHRAVRNLTDTDYRDAVRAELDRIRIAALS